MWKILKKFLRTIALWLPLCCMIVNAYAVDEIETIPLYPYMTMVWGSETSTQPFVKAFDNINSVDTVAAQGVNYKGIFVYQSALEKNTFYHIRMNVDCPAAVTQGWLSETSTGVITQTGGEVKTLMFPANTLAPYAATIKQAHDSGTHLKIGWSYDSAMVQSITSYVGAKAYYYLTRNSDRNFTIDCVFYFNDEFFQYGWSYDASSTRYMQCYLGLVIPVAGNLGIKQMDVYPVGGNDYNGKLDRIISLLQAQGGGLSREDIQAATLAALEQHDAAEEQKGNNKIQQIKQQIESITEPYKENLNTLQDATRSITSALNYSGTDAVLTFPEARNPMADNALLWEEKEIDLAEYWEQLPQPLKSAITIILTFLILYKVILEMVDEIIWVIYMDKNVDKAERNAIGL